MSGSACFAFANILQLFIRGFCGREYCDKETESKRSSELAMRMGVASGEDVLAAKIRDLEAKLTEEEDARCQFAFPHSQACVVIDIIP